MFELNDTLYAKAKVSPTEEVYLWLGVRMNWTILRSEAVANLWQANVMLSYPINEAEELLSSKLLSAQTSLSNCEEDLDFLREQITVSVASKPLSSHIVLTEQ